MKLNSTLNECIVYIFNQEHNDYQSLGVTGVFSFTSNIKCPRNYTRNIIIKKKTFKIYEG
jgi:hypothetical protein